MSAMSRMPPALPTRLRRRAKRSALAELAHQRGVGTDRTLVVQGLYDHINFIHHPDPLVLRVVEVAPPDPPKLCGLIKHVLSYADLPTIRVKLERIEIADLARQAPPRSIWCRVARAGSSSWAGTSAFSMSGLPSDATGP